MSLKGAGEMNLIIWQNGYTYNGTDKQWPGYNPDLPWIAASDPDLDSPEGWERARKVREAIGLSIDRQKIVDELLGGEGEPGATYRVAALIGAGMAGHGWEWPYDPEQAKQLLTEAGYEDGFDIDISTAATRLCGLPSQSGLRGDGRHAAGCWHQRHHTRTYSCRPILYDAIQGPHATGHHLPTYQSLLWRGTRRPAPPGPTDPELLWGVGWDHPWFTERMRKASETFDFEERWAIQVGNGPVDA